MTTRAEIWAKPICFPLHTHTHTHTHTPETKQGEKQNSVRKNKRETPQTQIITASRSCYSTPPMWQVPALVPDMGLSESRPLSPSRALSRGLAKLTHHLREERKLCFHLLRRLISPNPHFPSQNQPPLPDQWLRLLQLVVAGTLGKDKGIKARDRLRGCPGHAEPPAQPGAP